MKGRDFIIRVKNGQLKFMIPKNIIEEKYFKELKSQYNIAKELGVTQYAISARMKEYEMKTFPKHLKMVNLNKQKAKKVDLNVFNEMNKNVAWLLGWIVSDGSISSRCLTFHISEKDEEILHKFKKLLKYEGKIYHYNSKLNGKIYKVVTLKINDKKLISKLKEFGIKPKNKTIYPVIINKENEEINKNFIRGIFEGDGSIIKKKDGGIIFEIVGTRELLQFIQTKLIAYLNLNKTKLTKNKKLNNHYLLRYGGKKTPLRILSWLYQNYGNLKLKRKYEKFLEIKNEVKI